MRIVYMGTPEFAVAPLKTLIESGFNVVAVVTGEDKPQGRGRKVLPTPVKEFALQNNIPVLQPSKLKDEAFLEELRSYNADLQIVVAFRMLPEVVWSMPKLGTFNLHTAILPQYRGAAPINWAIINGEEKTGVTTFFLDKDIDTGKIILKQEVDILPEDNAGSLYDKLMIEGSKLVKKTVEIIESGTVETIEQNMLIDQNTVLKPAPKIFKEDCRIDFSKKGKDIKNLVRGLSPYPCAFTTINIKGKEMSLKVFQVEFEEDNSVKTAGEIITDNKKILKISCADGYIQLLDIQLEGKKRMKTEDFLRGVTL